MVLGAGYMLGALCPLTEEVAEVLALLLPHCVTSGKILNALGRGTEKGSLLYL